MEIASGKKAILASAGITSYFLKGIRYIINIKFIQQVFHDTLKWCKMPFRNFKLWNQKSVLYIIASGLVNPNIIKRNRLSTCQKTMQQIT